VLIDGGPHEAGPELVTFLRGRGVVGPLDLVLLTHRHADHLGGLAAVIEQRGARLFMDPGFAHPSPAYDLLLGALERARVPLREARAGRTVDLGGEARLVLLGPPEPPGSIRGVRSDVNANSVVARLEYRRVRVLLAGDAEPETERWLLAQGADVRATVLKVAHHGGRYSTTAAFLRAVAPEAAVISVGAVNEYGHPAPITLQRLARAGARVYRTDVDGRITLETDGERWEVATAQ